MSDPALARILVVDDVPEFLELVVDELREAGYTVAAAGGAVRAIEELRDGSFDVVLSDIQMPDGTGVDILRAVRDHDLDTPVILMTGSPSVATAVEALELGALRYLLKPFEDAALLDAVRLGVRYRQLMQLRRLALAQTGGAERLLADRAGLEAVFARGLAGLWLAYQPIVWARDGRLFGHEALLRTSEPALPHPGAFLDAAERLGRLRELGRGVRAAAAADMAKMPGRTVLVNLHPADLMDPQLPSEADPLAHHAASVFLEITERASLDGVTELPSRIGRLRAVGYRTAIDDLGSGYSGLTAFAALEPDMVKLDMGLVRGVDRHPLRRRLVQSMAELCHSLGILVLAEGVETEEERAAVTEAGCELLQGFLIGRPAPLEVPGS